MNGKKKKYQRRIPAAAIAAVCILVLCSGTALAVYKYLTPAEVAKEADDDTLQQAFLSDDAIPGNETQESGGYRLTLLGSVAGKNISDFIPSEGTGNEAEAAVDDNKIYRQCGGQNQKAKHAPFFAPPGHLIGQHQGGKHQQPSQQLPAGTFSIHLE